MEKIKNYIAGEFVPPHSGDYLPNFSPATGEIYSLVPDSDHEDVNKAVKAARTAFPLWSTTPSRDRVLLMRKIASEIFNQRESLARAECIDTGKPLASALQIDIPRSVHNFEFFSDAVSQFASECHPTDPTTLNYTLRNPLGVVGCISPWNLPLYLLTWKIAPALATGNTVVAKPSEVTPMTAYLLTKICADQGLPPGVLNVVHGTGAKTGATLSSHPDVQAISFTGSTKTGADIMRAAASTFKKLSLEMGGKNPTIVFADAPFDEAVSSTLRAAFSNQGQICLCGSRIYVERPIYERFKQALVAQTLNLKIGDPLDQVNQGSLVSRAHYEKVLNHIKVAQQENGVILTGGVPVTVKGCENGWFVAPTLIENLSYDSSTNQDEIFGPVATLAPFDLEEDVIKWANSTKYGLSATIWTSNLSRAHRVASAIQVGMVWINSWMLRDLRTPFGGVKHSGFGREGGIDALKFFTEPKNICIQF